MRCMRPAWRISTYSSRLDAVMARNLTRSSRGLVGSSASSRTRRLNCIQDSSRPLKSSGFVGVFAIVQTIAVLVRIQRLALGGPNAGNREQGTGDSEQGTGDRGHGTDFASSPA